MKPRQLGQILEYLNPDARVDAPGEAFIGDDHTDPYWQRLPFSSNEGGE